MPQESYQRAYAWFSFFGLLFLLIGIFASARTAYNFLAYENYPQGGVLQMAIPGISPYYGSAYSGQTEEACKVQYDPYAEERIQKVNQEVCIANVRQAREDAKVADISHSFFYLLLGGGILLLRKRVLGAK